MAGRRVEGVDVARGIASLVMIQGHAYHGWVAAAHHDTASYQLTRLLGTLPLPAFLVLAGAAITHRVEAAARRGEAATGVRHAVMRRGFMVLLWGYVTNAAFAAMDGGRGLDTLLRADVLHLIGLSIVVLAWVGIRDGGGGAPSLARLGWVALGLGAGVTLACPWLTAATTNTTGPARYLVGLVGDVPGVTRMPLVPLLGWMCAGVGVGLAMIRRRTAAPADAFAARAGAPARTLIAFTVGALAVATAAHAGTDAWVARSGEALTRAHPAVWLNAVDLAARGVLVLALAALVSTRLPARARGALVRLGQGSLVAYVFHIPFCYGALGAPLVGSLDMPAATAWVVALMVVSYGAVVVRDGVRAWRRGVATGRPTLAS